MGISIGDNSWYLKDAAYLRGSSFLYYQYWQPLYYLWLNLLTLVCPDPVFRYFLSWGIIAALLALVPLLLKIPSAWMYSFIILTVPFLTIGPFLAQFGSVFVLFAMCLVLRRQRPLSELFTAACITCFIVGFSRSEYDYGVFLSAFATAAAMLWEAFKASDTEKPSRNTQVAMLGAVIAAASIMLFCMSHSRLQRSGAAFAQHVNLRAADNGLIPRTNFLWRSNYAEQAFGIDLNNTAATGKATMADFFRANPRLFLRHVWYNLSDYRTIVLLLVILAVYLWTWLSAGARQLRHASLFLLLMILPPIAAILTIYPRDHYAMLIVPSLLIFVLQLPRPQLRSGSSPLLPFAVLAMGMALIWIGNVTYPKWRPGRSVSIERCYLQRVRCTRSVDKLASTTNSYVFDSASVSSVYLAHPDPLSPSRTYRIGTSSSTGLPQRGQPGSLPIVHWQSNIV